MQILKTFKSWLILSGAHERNGKIGMLSERYEKDGSIARITLMRDEVINSIMNEFVVALE